MEEAGVVAGPGTTISRFPVTLDAAQAAKARGMHVTMGAPSALLGQSLRKARVCPALVFCIKAPLCLAPLQLDQQGHAGRRLVIVYHRSVIQFLMPEVGVV